MQEGQDASGTSIRDDASGREQSVDEEMEAVAQDTESNFAGGMEDDTALVERMFRESMNDTNLFEGHKEVQYDHAAGRVIGLSIGMTLASPMDPIEHYWDLSPTIGRLDALESLTLTCCKVLPPELGHLKNLKKLTLITCKTLQRFPDGMFHNDNGDNCLSQLEEFRLVGSVLITPTTLIHRIAPLKNLRVLQLAFSTMSEPGELSWLRELIKPNAIQFHESLKELVLNRCHITAAGFHLVVTQMLKRCPNLKTLSLANNKIKSLHFNPENPPAPANDSRDRRDVDTSDELELLIERQRRDYIPMGERHESAESRDEIIDQGSAIGTDGLLPPLPTSHIAEEQQHRYQLKELILSDNPVWREDLKEEREKLAAFLEKHTSRLSYLGYRLERSQLWSPQIQFRLDLNKFGMSAMDEERNHTRNTLPFSLWAPLLEKIGAVLNQSDPISKAGVTCSPAMRISSIIYHLLKASPEVASRNSDAAISSTVARHSKKQKTM